MRNKVPFVMSGQIYSTFKHSINHFTNSYSNKYYHFKCFEYPSKYIDFFYRSNIHITESFILTVFKYIILWHQVHSYCSATSSISRNFTFFQTETQCLSCDSPLLPPLRPWQPSFSFHLKNFSLWIWLLLVSNISEMIQYLSFYD